MDTQKIDTELATWENETIFDPTLLPGNFIELVDEVYQYTTPFQLRMSLEYYKQLRSHTELDFSLMEINNICLVCKLRTQDEMRMGKDEYFEFQEGIENIAVEYRKLTAEKKKALEYKYTAPAYTGEMRKTIELPS